ncbi:PalH/RIM21-domain-containing protein [Immersiella caudata]|uniref:PalH/RIM21-domain-containing protein n=1 Tax=Immersiella caudata TaxID=314043 RepID=A0AA39WXR0_9PEZI|nr:PalH/RIM21-domain-containing protein [Immersiella caudata]
MAEVSPAPPEATAPLILPSLRGCSAFNLPPGVLSMANGDEITLTATGAYRPACTLISPPAIIANGGGSLTNGRTEDTGTETYLGNGDIPFYASVFPQCYALAATTVVAYMLVIMLFITPRSFLDGGVVVLGRKGFTNGGTGTSIGGRPWLQKVAALSVAISLTIATATTFNVAEAQYYGPFEQNAEELQIEVLGGNELKIIRIISNTFLWLAQAQTLIRLFPRQREKVIIKWTAFALITLDIIFQSLNSFQYTNNGATRPRSFTDAVPALSYLFALALGVLYAAWVIYYALMKKRYAFYHPQMKNMCLVAALSLLSILVPVVFFVLDISQPDFTGWGDYVRWVGAAAASVVVWEWVERIEALEREEKKDGILGREVFDGDEMSDITSVDRTRSRRRRKGPDDKDDEDGGESGRPKNVPPTGRLNVWPSVAGIRARYRSPANARRAEMPGALGNTQSTNHDRIRFLQPPLWPARPAPAVTPVSRTDTASAASTIYAVRYHPLTETTSRTTPPPGPTPATAPTLAPESNPSDEGIANPAPESPAKQIGTAPAHATNSGNRWRALAQGLPFRRPQRPDEERITPTEKTPRAKPKAWEEGSGWDIRNRLEEFAMTQAEKFRERIRPTPDTDSLPVTVIPAPPRRGAVLAQLLEEEELESQRTAPRTVFDRRNSSTSRTLPPGDESVPNSPTYASQPLAQRPSVPAAAGIWYESEASGSSSTNRHSRAGKLQFEDSPISPTGTSQRQHQP